MLVALTIYFSLALTLLLAWYAGFSHYNRRRSRRVLQWIGTAFAGHGRVAGVRWRGPGEFRARLELSPNTWFTSASVLVRMTPRELPLRWFRARMRRQPELLTFEADLDSPPKHDLEVLRHRWYGRTRRGLPPPEQSERGPVVQLTTRSDWAREASHAVDWWRDGAQRAFLNVSFHPASPHFSATLPLAAITPASPLRGDLFPAFEQLAGASASRL